MATRGTIALEFADGSVQMVYSHWDNYLAHNGRILKEHYSDPFKLAQLIELGSISSLAPEIGTNHPFGNPHRWGTPEFQAFNDQYGGMTTFYGRDRGDGDTQASRFQDFADYDANGQWEEYNYILRQIDGKARWFVNGMTFEELAAQEADDE
jgi:hypothetical protein